MLTIHLTIVVFLPLAAGVLAAFLPARFAPWTVMAGSAGVLGYAVAMIVDFDSGAGMHYVTDASWISELGIRYALGIDGLSLFLVALTAALWPVAIGYAARASRYQVTDRPRLYYFHVALAETAVLGAFCAQDLALFVVFFDLMLVPFYFLIGAWGEENRVAATTKFVIYTLAGSLLMLAAAVALGVIATPDGGQISFSLADLEERSLPTGSQNWIFLLFAAAFLVKAPAFPLHGWMPDAYRATPIPILILLSAVLSKVGAYGFLRIVLPLLPDASRHFQDLMIVIAVASILYGSVLAFSQVNARLIVGYSSIAQLGFITLGIFSLDPKGAQGAVMQMVNHGLVAAALFLVIAVLARRAGGSESVDDMGGIAFRAPALAAVFLIVAFATLAMPGSGNFVGELLILFGAFEDKLVYGLVASAGVVLASVYMIRFVQRAMHNRTGSPVESSDLCPLERYTLLPLTAIIVALGVYPQLILERTERATVARIDPARQVASAEAGAAAQGPEGAQVPGASGAPSGGGGPGGSSVPTDPGAPAPQPTPPEGPSP